MAQERQSLQSDILVPDDIVILLDGSVKTVARSMKSDDALRTLNYRLLSLRPADLDSLDQARNKISQAITDIEAGKFDLMFAVVAVRQKPNSDHVHEATTIRDQSLTHLRSIQCDDQLLAEILDKGKSALAADHDLRIQPTSDSLIQEAATYLNAQNSPITGGMDRLFTAERIPLLLCNEANSNIVARLPGYTGNIKPTDAAYVYLSSSFFDVKTAKPGRDQLAFNQILFDQVLSRGLGVLATADVAKMLAVDMQKINYELDRKRSDVVRYNKTNRRSIEMFDDAETTARTKLRVGPEAASNITHDDMSSIAGQVHHLLTYYQDPKDKEQIKNRFDHTIAFHDRLVAAIDFSVDGRILNFALPQTHAVSDIEDNVGPPLTAQGAVDRATTFARQKLPDHYRLRSYLKPTPDHQIDVKLTNDAGETHERIINLRQPNAEAALDIKRQVQAQLLDMPGIVPYRGPQKEGNYVVNLDELIPATPARHRIAPKYGEYHLKLDWRDCNEEVVLPLGVHYSAENREEATRRAEFVLEQLQNARAINEGRTHLPLTKRDIIDRLRVHVQQQNGRWDERTHGEIGDFPIALRFPFSKPGAAQESWLQIGELKTDGDPNYTWILPVSVIVNGQRLANASTHVNLHVRERSVAEQRAIDAVNHMMRIVSSLPPDAQWAIDPEHPRHLLNLSEAARTAELHLIDTNRLTDIQNELRSPYQQDLRVELVGEPVVAEGKQTFSLGIVRGGDHGLAEPVLANKEFNQPPVTVQRKFTVPVSQAADIQAFTDSINRTFRDVIREEYDPRSSLNYDAENIRKLKTPRHFNPNFAPNVFDRAIETHLKNFPDIESLDLHTSRARSRLAEAPTRLK